MQRSSAASGKGQGFHFFGGWRRRHGAHVRVNGKPVYVEWSAAAQAALDRRELPLTVELELYFSCLVKKFVHFHESAPAGDSITVTEQLRLVFRPVTSSACSMDLADRLGRQPEVDLAGPIVSKLAPRRVWIDHRRGSWHGEYWL
ncbi:hypothetical protein [Rubrivivax albus]|uniref:Uncharacterized protein n=1 Tax=Rubrivivax albus TaxID=2499835 RepID=A0A437JRX3_9BURK|nr:hypothetical protein [Rubrivivax albus]RVT49636.1 hypothetical protein ENE75_18485 [Rubrivivax albus]